jgi:peptidoglycan/LPS O-acetylase OafA/YrhL
MLNIQLKKGYIPALDGVRGCAILLVLLFHCLKTSVFPFSTLSEIGWIGVDLFFVLSGFLITGILIDTRGCKNFLAIFIYKRILRIFPLYYLCLFIFFITLFIPKITIINFYLDKRFLNDIFYYLTFTQNILFSFRGWNESDILNHFWSLALEEQFYLFWPIIVMLFRNKNIILISVFLISISLITRNLNPTNPFSYVFTFARIDALVIGSISAILIRTNIQLLNKYVHYTFVITLAIILFIIILTHSVSLGNIAFIKCGYTFFDIQFASLIILVFDTKRIGMFVNNIFSAKILTFLGKYSYGIYIYHWLLYRGVYAYLEAKFNLPSIFTFPFIGFVILISFMSYHLYEKRFLKYKFKINQKSNLRELIFLTKKKTS